MPVREAALMTITRPAASGTPITGVPTILTAII
jgi:hypothetical protein